MSSIHIETDNLVKKLNTTLETMKNFHEQGKDLGVKVLEMVKDATPVKTGQTRDSWILITEAGFLEVSWRIEPKGREEIVRILEFGTRPHVILGKPLLAFEVEGKGVFTTVVHHPGTKPLGFVRALQDYVAENSIKIDEAMMSAIKVIWA